MKSDKIFVNYPVKGYWEGNSFYADNGRSSRNSQAAPLTFGDEKKECEKHPGIFYDATKFTQCYLCFQESRKNETEH